MTDEIEPAPTREKLPALDQKLVLEVARAMWKVSAWQQKLEPSLRKADWDQSKSQHISQARKLIRQLHKDNVTILLNEKSE